MSLVLCLQKFARDFDTLDHERVAEASRAYQNRGEQERAADISAIEDHLAELAAEGKRISTTITDAFQAKNPTKYQQAIDRKIAENTKAPEAGDTDKTAAKSEVKPEAEVDPASFHNQMARQIVENTPGMKIATENGVVDARAALDAADAEFKVEVQKQSLFKTAIACAIGVGE